jgi:hypothetical protein
MATADQLIAVEQIRHLQGKKQRLQEEFASIVNAVVIARRQDIQDQVAAINVQLAAIAPRLPPAPAPAPESTPLRGS